MEETVLQKKEKLLLILSALFAGIFFNYLFYGKTPGLSYPVYVVFLLCLFWWSTRKMLIVEKSFGWFILIPVLLLSATFAIHSNPVLQALNLLLIPLLMVAHTLLVTNKSTTWSKLSIIGDILKRVFPLTLMNIPKPFLFAAGELKTKEPGAGQLPWKKIATGLLISLPILLVVLPLLSSADMMFNYYLNNLTEIEDFIELGPTVKQGIIILIVFVYISGYLWSFYISQPETETGKAARDYTWDPTILLTVLFVINVVYLLFSMIQFSYLYGERHSLPAAFTYAEYARRGFFELVAVTVINLSILLCSMKFVKTENKGLYIVVQGFLSLLIVFSLNMLFSANFKMSLYEEAYGLTYLRIFVHYFLALLLVLFLVASINIWLKKPPLVKAYIIITLVFYTALNFINVDKIIARHNIDMYFKTGKIDVYYLQSLSYDAIPEMTKLAQGNRAIPNQVNNYLFTVKQDLSKAGPWQSFNYSRYKAYTALIKHFK